MTITALEQQLIAQAQHFRADMIALCADLLQTPSVNGVNDERAVALIVSSPKRRTRGSSELAALARRNSA